MERNKNVGVVVLGCIIFAIIGMITILGVEGMQHPSPPTPARHQFDAKDYYAADQWCHAHGYSTVQDVVHGVSSTEPSTVVGASCLDPNDKMGNHIPAPSPAASAASGA